MTAIAILITFGAFGFWDFHAKVQDDLQYCYTEEGLRYYCTEQDKKDLTL